jgi:hypothetical protein
MFRLSESDYRRLEPLAMKVYKYSARSANVARLMESKVGRRALVDMMFLERTAWHPDLKKDKEWITKLNAEKRAKQASKDNYMGTWVVTGEDMEDALENARIEAINASAQAVTQVTTQAVAQGETPSITQSKEETPFAETEEAATQSQIFIRLESLKKVNQAFKDKEMGYKNTIRVQESTIAGLSHLLKLNEEDLRSALTDKAKFEKIILTGRNKLLKDLEKSTGNKELLAYRISLAKQILTPEQFSNLIDKAKKDPNYARAFVLAVKNERLELTREQRQIIRESLKADKSIKGYLSRISNWFKGKLDPILKKIYSFFVVKNKDGSTSIKWLHIAIVAVVIIAIGFLLFGTSAGQKIRNFVLNVIKTGINGIRSAVRYVLGKGGAPKDAINDTEDFLDEATA